VLIVCEGQKTEPNYFNGLRDDYELSTANIEIGGNCGSDPVSIYKYAKKRFREERERGDPFDKVYCVFDKDSHVNFQQAVDAISRSMPKQVYEATVSVPCFEYWLLLHFIYTSKPYMAQGSNSSCSQVISDLKAYLPDYEKGQANVYLQLKQHLETAKVHALRAKLEAEDNNTDNPSTRVHELVEFLQNIRN
jgi:hypothetical protein